MESIFVFKFDWESGLDASSYCGSFIYLAVVSDVASSRLCCCSSHSLLARDYKTETENYFSKSWSCWFYNISVAFLICRYRQLSSCRDNNVSLFPSLLSDSLNFEELYDIFCSIQRKVFKLEVFLWPNSWFFYSHLQFLQELSLRSPWKFSVGISFFSVEKFIFEFNK